MENKIPMGEAPVIKHLIDVSSGDKAEAIYFNRPEKQVICLSCQLSCPVGCVFCASPDGNPTVNLTVYDMIDQIKAMSQTAMPGKPMLISFMGEGEPALNIDRIMEVMVYISEQELPYPVRFAISTSGVKPSAISKLLEFTKDFALPVKLQLSLHAPTDEGRAKIIPVSKPLSSIIPAVEAYHRAGNAVDINYTMIKDQNDRREDLYNLIKLIGPTGLHVKLSRYNKVEGSDLERSDNAEFFLSQLAANGISCEYHFTDGEKSDAACGQTRSSRSKL